MFVVYLLTLVLFRLLIQILRQLVAGIGGWQVSTSAVSAAVMRGTVLLLCFIPHRQWALNQRGKDASKQILHRPAGSTPSLGVVTSPILSRGEVFPSP